MICVSAQTGVVLSEKTADFGAGQVKGYEIENEFFRMFIAPPDGGRILSLFDKRLGKDIEP